MTTTRKGQRGFGLIEILITLGVLSVGILGVTVLNSVITRQSLDNKARAEALALAQSRIEEMRNYTNSASTQAEFETLYAALANGNSTSIAGVNTTFTRTETITAAGNLRNVVVSVGWADPDNEAQSLSLNSELAFVAPRSAGDTALESSDALVNAPTGRARLGEGELPGDAVTTDNGDGTALYQAGGADLMLVSDDQIVLTLTEACQTENGTCIDFVKIKGTIWIDTNSHAIEPGHVYVVASDAAFCARHYTVGGTTAPVTPNTTSTVTTASGDYEYFDYTCYLGGGWHGNVGVILAGGLTQSDKICIGDPVSNNAWEAPVIASRRVYRGMLYKHDPNNASLKEEVSDGQGGTLIRYYSQGVEDSIVLPDPDTSDKGHDFVIASMNASQTEGSNCISQGVMVRADSNVNGALGDLFAGMPTDFICLNDGLLDNYDSGVYGNSATCPYNPSDPPSTRHVLSGSILVEAQDTATNDLLMDTVSIRTSDGPGNCLTSTFSASGGFYTATYECDVYDWGNGWNGYVEATYDAASMSCSPNRLPRSDIAMDTANINFASCVTGSYAVISGTVTASGNRKLASATISGGGTCTLAVDSLSYECVSTALIETTFTGTVTLTATAGRLCPETGDSRTFSFTDLAGGYYTQNATIGQNANACIGVP